MDALLRLSKGIDGVTGVFGRVTSWLATIMVLVGALNAIARYLGRFIGFNLSSNAYLELQWYLFSLIFLLGAGYALRENAHVRVDVMYARFSRRTQALIDIVGTLVLLAPFSIFVLVVSWGAVRNSFAVREGSPDPGGLIRYPLKAVILVCFVLLLIQGFSQLVKAIDVVRQTGPAAEPVDAPEADPLQAEGRA